MRDQSSQTSLNPPTQVYSLQLGTLTPAPRRTPPWAPMVIGAIGLTLVATLFAAIVLLVHSPDDLALAAATPLAVPTQPVAAAPAPTAAPAAVVTPTLTPAPTPVAAAHAHKSHHAAARHHAAPSHATTYARVSTKKRSSSDRTLDRLLGL